MALCYEKGLKVMNSYIRELVTYVNQLLEEDAAAHTTSETDKNKLYKRYQALFINEYIEAMNNEKQQ